MSSSSPREVVLASWIHVSDLHFGHGAVGHQWNQRLVLGELLVDAEGLVRAAVVPRPDLIFVTGDIAFSGGARTPATGGSEYQLAAEWISRLQISLKIPQEHVFLVPGNHDVDRSVDKDADIRRMLRLARSGEETIDELLQTPRELERLRSRMARYLAFAESFGPDAGARRHGGLWWQTRVELAEGVALRLCGLNTALLAADEHDQGKLRVGERQLAELFDPAPGDLDLTVVLGHHPATGRWLADEKEVRAQLDRRAALHLFGHLHEADSEQARHGWGTGCLRIAAGAAHAEAGAGHGYNFGALVVLESGDLAVRIWPRRWSPRTPRFVADVDNTTDHRDFAEHRLPERFRIHRVPLRSGLHPGDLLGGRYQLLADVGQGGVGQVWRALDKQRGEEVAVKVLNPHGAPPTPELRARFFGGAQAMAQVHHPSIVRVRDPRPDPEYKYGPFDFYVMDFIDAPNLSAFVKGAPRSDGETIEILIAIAEALAPAHARDFIHCDLKPSNILRNRTSGRIFIVDYDTVKNLRNLTVTPSATKLMDETYSAPEVRLSLRPASGAPPRIDRRADIFSLAVIGIFLRTGSDPYFIGILPQMLADIECGPELKRVLTKGSAAASADRFGSLDELIAALRSINDSASASPANVRAREHPEIEEEEEEVEIEIEIETVPQSEDYARSAIRKSYYQEVFEEYLGALIKNNEEIPSGLTFSLFSELLIQDTVDKMRIPGALDVTYYATLSRGRGEDVARVAILSRPITQDDRERRQRRDLPRARERYRTKHTLEAKPNPIEILLVTEV